MALSRFILPYADVGSGIKPPSGAQLFFYETGTSQFKDTYTDVNGLIPNDNPVIADSTGLFGDIFITDTYKVVLKDKAGTQIWEADPVTSTSASELSVIARSLNVEDGQVIYATDTTTPMGEGDGVDYVYDAATQKTSALPSGITAGSTITTGIVGDQISTTTGDYTVVRVLADLAPTITYTFKAKDGNSAFENMLLGNNDIHGYTVNVNDIYSTGGTKWKVISLVGNEERFKPLTSLFVGDFGEIGLADDSATIQSAIDASNDYYLTTAVRVASHTITYPVVTYARTTLTSNGAGGITKTTNTAATGLIPQNSPNGEQVDDFNVNACLICYHGDTEWTFNWSVENLFLSNVDGYVIYAPRIIQSQAININLTNGEWGFYTHNIFMFKFSRFIGNNMPNLFTMAESGGGYVGGTSVVSDRMWSNTGGKVSLNKLSYSTFTSLAIEKVTDSFGLYIEACNGVAFNSLGTESNVMSLGTVYVTVNSTVTINGWNNFNDEAQAHLWVVQNSLVTVNGASLINDNSLVDFKATSRDSSRVTFTGCKIAANSDYQVQSGATIQHNDEQLPVLITDQSAHAIVIGGVAVISSGDFISTGLGAVALAGATAQAVTSDSGIYARLQTATSGSLRVYFDDNAGNPIFPAPVTVMWTATIIPA